MSNLDKTSSSQISCLQTIDPAYSRAPGVNPTSEESVNFKPQRLRRREWEQGDFSGRKGEIYVILKNKRTNIYVKLNEQQAYAWELMDGTRTESDLVFEIFMRYKTLAIESTHALVEQLWQKGFLTVPPKVDELQLVRERQIKSQSGYRLKRAFGYILQSEFSIPGIDRIITLLSLMFGWMIFSIPMQILFLLITLLGVPAFYLVVKRGDLSFFVGAHGMLHVGFATMLIAQVLAIFVHEMAHALTTKHYGREVRRGGVGMYFGMLAFFVDTTDIWMAGRKARVAVTWAGPYSGLILGAIASLTLLLHPLSVFYIENFYYTSPYFYHHYLEPLVTHRSVWAGLMYQFATFCYAISFLNLNPLLKLDGYYILMDWLDIPMLRERSMSFVRGDMIEKSKKRQKFTSEEIIYTVFGLLAFAWTGFALLSIFILYGGKLKSWLAGYVGDQAAWVILIGAGGLILGVYILRSTAAARRQVNFTKSGGNQTAGGSTSMTLVETRLSRAGVQFLDLSHSGSELERGRKAKTFEKPASSDIG